MHLVLDSDYPDFELTIVDNGSSDGSISSRGLDFLMVDLGVLKDAAGRKTVEATVQLDRSF